MVSLSAIRVCTKVQEALNKDFEVLTIKDWRLIVIAKLQEKGINLSKLSQEKISCRKQILFILIQEREESKEKSPFQILRI